MNEIIHLIVKKTKKPKMNVGYFYTKQEERRKDSIELK